MIRENGNARMQLVDETNEFGAGVSGLSGGIWI